MLLGLERRYSLQKGSFTNNVSRFCSKFSYPPPLVKDLTKFLTNFQTWEEKKKTFFAKFSKMKNQFYGGASNKKRMILSERSYFGLRN